MSYPTVTAPARHRYRVVYRMFGTERVTFVHLTEPSRREAADALLCTLGAIQSLVEDEA